METTTFNAATKQNHKGFEGGKECDVHHVMEVDFRRYFVLSF